MFGWTRIFAVVAVAAMVAIVTGGAGATSTPTFVPATVSHAATAGKVSTAAARSGALLTTANLNTRAGAARYLRAIGVDPRGLVIQRGARNYAGPNCPGAGWTCTSTAHPVIQIAAAGGKNTFLCTTGSCAVVQATRSGTPTKTRSLAAAAAPNKATCIKTTGLSQSCSISQNSASTNNEAIVYENISKTSGLTQTASSTAQITQKGTGSVANKACVLQNINVEGSTVAKKGTPVTVTLEAHQSISINQDAIGGANTVQGATAAGACDTSGSTDPFFHNVAPLQQTQALTSTTTGSGSIKQNENAVDSGPPTNVSLVIAQNQSAGFLGSASVTGVNTAAFLQTNSLTASASSPAGPVSQTQSSPSGGILATVNQFSHNTGLLNASNVYAKQIETQCEHAQTTGSPSCSLTEPQSSLPNGWTQKQWGPMKNGGGGSPAAAPRTFAKVGKDAPSIQADNPHNSFMISQSSTQANDRQTNDTDNVQLNNIQGSCSTSGNCTDTQNTNINNTPSSNTESGSNVNTQTTCSGSTCANSGPTTSSTLTVLPSGLSVSNTDVAEFGFGGMRGIGTGSITASGITGPVAHAFLYWNGPTSSVNPASNASVMFGVTPITGTNIGTASSNCWDPTFTNSQSYRADVTSQVTGNGTYNFSDFLKADADINGVSLIVFYDDGNSSNDRNVVLWNGNDSNFAFGSDPSGWDETISGVPYPGSGTASLDFVVSDGQTASDGALVLNETILEPAGNIFQGDSTPAGPSDNSGSLWDVKSFDITSFLTSPSTDLHLTSAGGTDCISLVVAAANVPVTP
jgi:hypothetical protein